MKRTKLTIYLFFAVLVLLLVLPYGGTQTTKTVLAHGSTLTTAAADPPEPGFHAGPHSDPASGVSSGCRPKEKSMKPPDVKRSGNFKGQKKSWTDYYLGSWTFIEGDEDLTVTRWCKGELNKGGGIFYYYSLEISTSVHTKDTWTMTPRISPTDHCCPYDGGKNRRSGLPGPKKAPKDYFKKIPSRVDWISRNPHLEGGIFPEQDGQKIIYWVNPDRTIVKGKITKRNDKRPPDNYEFEGDFVVGEGKPKPVKDLSPDDKKELIKDFDSEYKTTFVSAGSNEAEAGSNEAEIETCAFVLTEADGYFTQTGFLVEDPFWQYWQPRGGLAQQGYPISDEFTDICPPNGKPYTVQYFERAVFEYHPEYANTPYEVLLSQLGTAQFKNKYPSGAPNQKPNQTNARYFPETGHWVGGRFWQYWQEHGGLPQQGYPLTDEFTEVSDLNSKPYLVQYFERSVMEYHPEYAGTPYEVLLSQLGTFYYRQYQTRCPTATPTPQAATGTPTPTSTSALPTPLSTVIPVPPTSIPEATSAPPISTNTSTSVQPTGTPTPHSATAVTTSTPVTTGTPAGCTITFTDVPPDSTFYTWIRCLACLNIISGYSDGTFRPDNDIIRGQTAKAVSNAAGYNDAIPSDRQTFEDVPPDHPFWLWIERLFLHGVMGGYPCGADTEPCNPPGNLPYFRPNASITRGQLAKIVANAAGIGGTPTGLYYTDVPEEHPFYVWIMRLTDLGVMTGYPCGGEGEPCDDQNRPYFRPFANVTRGQASKIIANTFYPNCQTPQR